MKIEVYARRNWLGQLRHYFRARAANGQVLIQSEGYSRRFDAIGTLHSLRNGFAKAEIVDVD